MQGMTERFEMRLSQSALSKVDTWRSNQGDVPSRAEAVRRLVEAGLGVEQRLRLSDGEKLILMMLCEIFKHLKLGHDGIDPDFIEDTINNGHLWGLKQMYRGIFDVQEDDERVIAEVKDILEMWTFIERGIGRLAKKEKEQVAAKAPLFGKQAVFPGFDGNNESEYGSVAGFLIGKLGHFSSIKNKNSHMPCLSGYRRMLSLFRPMRDSLVCRELTASEIVQLLDAWPHPEARSDA